MRVMSTLLVLGLMAGLPAVASAQDGRKKHGKKEALLKKFDKDGDGKLSKEERRAAKESMRKDGKGKGGGKSLRKRILNLFDSDGDRKLDDKERDALRKFLDSHRGKHGKRRR